MLSVTLAAIANLQACKQQGGQQGEVQQQQQQQQSQQQYAQHAQHAQQEGQTQQQQQQQQLYSEAYASGSGPKPHSESNAPQPVYYLCVQHDMSTPVSEAMGWRLRGERLRVMVVHLIFSTNICMT